LTILLILLVSTSILLLIPAPKLRWGKSIMCATTIAFAVALGIYWLSPFWINTANASPVKLTAVDRANELAEGTEVWVKGAQVDDHWYPASHIFAKNGNWIKKDSMVGWRSFDQPEGMTTEIIAHIPAGKVRILILEANPWRGLVEIRQNDDSPILVDAYHGQQDQEISIPLEEHIPFYMNQWHWGLSIAAFLMAILGILWLYVKFPVSFEVVVPMREDHVWGIDILRILCIFTVVLLHCTNGTFNWEFETNQQSWYQYLYINVATSFAVPCFFMLSGALLIRKDTTVKGTLIKRLPNAGIPLLFWSSIYIVVNIYYWNLSTSFWKAVLGALFTSQYWHLWFMYPLIGLYLLLPFIAQAYYHWDSKIQWYAGALILCIPAVIFTMAQITGRLIRMPYFAFGFPELGIFILGRLLWDTMSRYKIPIWVSLIAIFFSFSSICVSTYALSIQQNHPMELFGAYGNLFVTAFAASIFVLILSLESFWKSRLSSGVKHCISGLARLSMGVYFVHMLFLITIGNSKIFGVAFTNNVGSLHNMVLGSVIYFTCSAMFVCVLSHIPIIRKVVN